MDNKGTVYWITGLAGAGKTTIGKLLYQYIREEKSNIVLLDGDMLREMYGHDLGYSAEERLQVAMRNARLCKMLAEQKIDVICCTIAMFDAVRDWNRENIDNYFEIYLDVSFEVLYQRDQKGLYSKDGNNQVVGVNMNCELPKNPDLILNNDGDMELEQILQIIISKLHF